MTHKKNEIDFLNEAMALELEEATEIVMTFGRYMENGVIQLKNIFSTYIPESFLPYPKDVIQKAFIKVGAHYSNKGDKDFVESAELAINTLFYHVDDEEALLMAGKNFEDAKWRADHLPFLKKFGRFEQKHVNK